jgi:endonuclease YncB( thermonuclease family)
VRLLAILFLLLPMSVAAAQLTGKVVAISDGDTLTVLDSSNTQHKIRLSGIDAPEKKQPFGEKSKQALSDCAYGKTAVVEYDKKDRYGRTVGKVLVGPTECNLRQIDIGLAWHYKKYAGEQPAEDREAYARLEQKARAERRGLWVEQTAVAPWDFRKLR